MELPSESWEIGILRGREIPEISTCCPTEWKQIPEVNFSPERRSQHGEQPRGPFLRMKETSPHLQEKPLAFLLEPRSYRHRPKHVRLIQTHASYVLIAARHI